VFSCVLNGYLKLRTCFQVYSLQEGRRDVETVFTMGIMEDVNLVPQPAGGKDLPFLFDILNALHSVYFVHLFLFRICLNLYISQFECQTGI